MSKREVICWGAPDEERLTHDDMDEAIEAILDAWDGPLTGTVTVCGFARMPFRLDFDRILDDILERLDEELSNPDGEPTEPTPKMRAAAEALVDAIKADYVVWACEEVERHEIDVQAWVREHRPDWIDVEAV